MKYLILYICATRFDVENVKKFVLFFFKTKVVSNKKPIWEPKIKIDFPYNTYNLQQNTHTEDLFWISGEA